MVEMHWQGRVVRYRRRRVLGDYTQLRVYGVLADGRPWRAEAWLDAATLAEFVRRRRRREPMQIAVTNPARAAEALIEHEEYEWRQA